MSNEILVRMTSVGGRTPEAINESLAHGSTTRRYSSPGVEHVIKELESMESAGLVERDADGTWKLTAAGDVQYDRLEAAFDNSGGRGISYGF